MFNNLKLLVIAILLFTSTAYAYVKYGRQTEPEVPPVETGMASWYSRTDPGVIERTANNEIFDDQAFTCAKWDVPFHQRIKVTNIENGKSIVVRVNDRGPHRRLVNEGRVIDLTKKAFSKIANPENGLINVELEFL